MYAAIDDPYCYPGTTVLINKLGLQSQHELDAFESEISLPGPIMQAVIASFGGQEGPLVRMILDLI